MKINKFEMLDSLRDHLNQKHKKNTADKYFFAVKGLLRDIWDPLKLTQDEVKAMMQNERTKNDFSAAKNGLIEFKDIYPDFALPDTEFMKTETKKKRNVSDNPRRT